MIASISPFKIDSTLEISCSSSVLLISSVCSESTRNKCWLLPIILVLTVVWRVELKIKPSEDILFSSKSSTILSPDLSFPITEQIIAEAPIATKLIATFAAPPSLSSSFCKLTIGTGASGLTLFTFPRK